MSPSLITTLTVGALLVLALAAYALHLWRKVWHHQERLQAHQQEISNKLADDLRILCASLLDGQVPWIEGCIRIKVILEHYDFELGESPAYAVFRQVFAATEHIPRQDAWNALSRTEKQQHEKTFASLEASHLADSQHAARTLLDSLGGPIQAAPVTNETVQAWSPEQGTLH